jgi:hypothetical protein
MSQSNEEEPSNTVDLNNANYSATRSMFPGRRANVELREADGETASEFGGENTGHTIDHDGSDNLHLEHNHGLLVNTDLQTPRLGIGVASPYTSSPQVAEGTNNLVGASLNQNPMDYWSDWSNDLSNLSSINSAGRATQDSFPALASILRTHGVQSNSINQWNPDHPVASAVVPSGDGARHVLLRGRANNGSLADVDDEEHDEIDDDMDQEEMDADGEDSDMQITDRTAEATSQGQLLARQPQSEGRIRFSGSHAAAQSQARLIVERIQQRRQLPSAGSGQPNQSLHFISGYLPVGSTRVLGRNWLAMAPLGSRTGTSTSTNVSLGTGGPMPIAVGLPTSSSNLGTAARSGSSGSSVLSGCLFANSQEVSTMLYHYSRMALLKHNANGFQTFVGNFSAEASFSS